jgi:hypothetical protein
MRINYDDIKKKLQNLMSINYVDKKNYTPNSYEYKL